MTWSSRPTRPRRPPSAPACPYGIWTASPGTSSPKGDTAPNFTHRLGHFIGLETHDFGDVSSAAEDVAAPGNIFSIEPGIYLPGEMGVRIEDLALVTEDGVEILNHLPKALEVLP